MFDKPHEYTLVAKRPAHAGELYMQSCHIYKFKDEHLTVYRANVEVYLGKLYMIKFHLESLVNCKEKYERLTNINYPFRVLSTCLAIIKEYLKKDPECSFGFIGMKTPKEGDLKLTKRFRVYSQIMNNFFSPVKFDHTVVEKISLYLIVRKGITEQEHKQLEEAILHYQSQFEGYYPPVDFLSVIA